MRAQLFISVGVLFLLGCEKVEDEPGASFTPTPFNAAQQVESDRRLDLARDRYRINARATNARMKEYYDRGLKACERGAKAGFPDHDNCPPRVPNYAPID